MRAASLLVTLLLCATVVAAPAPPHFDESRIRATIQSLSSDAFAGRAPASAGEDRTIGYFARQFRRCGLQPANHGSFFQDVPMLQIAANPDTTPQVSGGERSLQFKHANDFVVTTLRPLPTVRLSDSPFRAAREAQRPAAR